MLVSREHVALGKADGSLSGNSRSVLPVNWECCKICKSGLVVVNALILADLKKGNDKLCLSLPSVIY